MAENARWVEGWGYMTLLAYNSWGKDWARIGK
jgi:hypothetical protein